MLTASALVLLMTPGLSFFYGGMVRPKNVISTMLQSFMAMGVVSLLWVVVALLNTLVSGNSLTNLPNTGFAALILIVLLYRYGLLALITAVCVMHLWVFFPITTELRAWYAFDFVLGALLCVGLATWGFYTSLAGQQLFAGNLLDD